MLNTYIMSLLNKHLEWNEMFTLEKSYGLTGPKWSAKEIAEKLEIRGVSSYVRVSELKKQAVDKLIENVDHSQVVDFL
jgi:ribosomal protein S13